MRITPIHCFLFLMNQIEKMILPQECLNFILRVISISEHSASTILFNKWESPLKIPRKETGFYFCIEINLGNSPKSPIMSHFVNAT